MKIKAIIASSIPPSQQLDSNRTQYILSKDAVKEVVRQINKRMELGIPLTLLPKPPKNDTDYKDGIGYTIKCELIEPPSYDCVQAYAEFYIEDYGRKEVDYPNFKKEKCIFLLLPYDDRPNGKSGKKIFSSEDDQVGIFLLEGNFGVFYAYIDEKRSSSNPFLIIR